MTNNIGIHKVGSKDIRAVVELLGQFAEINDVRAFKLLEPRIDSEKHLLLMAKAGTEAVGVLEASIVQYNSLTGGIDRGSIRTLYVKEEYRREKVATKMIDLANFWFKNREIDWIVVDVPLEDDGPKALFESLGYESYQIKMIHKVEVPG